MRTIVAIVVAIIALSSWDILAHDGKYRRAVAGMVGHIATHIH
jgi:hypothetical protein